MTEDELKQRTKQFALRLMKLVDALPINEANELTAIFTASVNTSKTLKS